MVLQCFVRDCRLVVVLLSKCAVFSPWKCTVNTIGIPTWLTLCCISSWKSEWVRDRKFFNTSHIINKSSRHSQNVWHATNQQNRHVHIQLWYNFIHNRKYSSSYGFDCVWFCICLSVCVSGWKLEDWHNELRKRQTPFITSVRSQSAEWIETKNRITDISSDNSSIRRIMSYFQSNLISFVFKFQFNDEDGLMQCFGRRQYD